MNRATVTCGCGSSASFEDEYSEPIRQLVEAWNKAHEACRIARRDSRGAVAAVEVQGVANPDRKYEGQDDCG